MNTWIITAIVVVVVIAVWWYFATFNGFVRLRNLIDESWRQVDVELQRRHDLVPNLVSTVTQAAGFERGTLEALTAARAQAVALSQQSTTDVSLVADAENTLSAALSRLTVVAEAYPQLQAIRNFEALQRELADTEDRIAAARRLYNANVRALNTRVGSMPASVVASIHKVGLAEYFEIADAHARSAVDVAQLFDPHRNRD